MQKQLCSDSQQTVQAPMSVPEEGAEQQ